MEYPLPLDTVANLVDIFSFVTDHTYQSQLIEQDTTRVMAELILKECMEKAQTESNLAKNANHNSNNKLSTEFFMELQRNAYHGRVDEDVVNHIAKILEILDLTKIPNEDTDQLRMRVFPLLLADNAREWWIDEGDGKINT
nr:hypothetical protein [Tanacetum cinerariifolium]